MSAFLKRKVIFSKIENSHNRLRDDVIEGICLALPTVGRPFYLAAEPRDPKLKGKGVREVNTSVVKEIVSHKDNVIRFKTHSGSIYEVKYSGTATQ